MGREEGEEVLAHKSGRDRVTTGEHLYQALSETLAPLSLDSGDQTSSEEAGLLGWVNVTLDCEEVSWCRIAVGVLVYPEDLHQHVDNGALPVGTHTVEDGEDMLDGRTGEVQPEDALNEAAHSLRGQHLL